MGKLGRQMIPATWQDFDGYGGEKSTYLHCFSEFIDNSVAAYLKANNNNINGLSIEILIDTFEKGSKIEQDIEIIDNASGMDDETLYQAIIPNNKEGKSDNSLNQYGVGMKLAAFWFARSLKIVTKENRRHQYSLEINITDSNLRDTAEVNIEKNDEDLIKIDNCPCNSGTYIKISNIRSTPNRIMANSDCDDVVKGLGWRYSQLLENFSLKIIFKSAAGKISTYNVKPFKLHPFVLNEAVDGIANQKNTKINKEQYKKLLLSNVKEEFEKNKNKINEITNKNFYEALENNEPLQFKFISQIEGKDVVVNWGILALKTSGLNGSYDYTELSGITLLNNGRAIMHGPNLSSGFKTKSGIKIGTYSLEKKDAGSGQAVYRRLFGQIDLTGVENADRNKTMFNWGPLGEKNLADIADKICTSMRDVLNAMQKAEKDEDVVKTKTVHSAAKRKKEKDIWEENFDSKVAVFSPTSHGGKFEIDFGGQKIIFYVIHCNASKQIAFDIESNLHNDNSIKVKINDDHYLWKDNIHKTDSMGLEFKVKFIYPLAIAFAICKIHYDDKNNSPFSSWKPDKLPAAFDKMKFDDWFDKILEHLSKK